MAQNVIRILTSSGWQDMTVQAANVTKAQAPIVLTRTSDGDTNGLIYWLGTRAGAFAPPVPEVNGGTTAIGEELRMYSSSTYPDGNYDLINMVDRVNNPGWAANVGTTEWVALDLKTRTLKPDQLTLKSRSDANSNHLKSFILEASQDGTNWTTLLTVANAAYTAVSQWKNWAVTPPAVGYRYLRVRSTGVDSTGGSSVIIGEFEIYGTLYLPDLPGATYQIQDEGVLLPLRGVMNFTGAGVAAVDDAANGRTTVRVPGPVIQDLVAASSTALTVDPTVHTYRLTLAGQITSGGTQRRITARPDGRTTTSQSHLQGNYNVGAGTVAELQAAYSNIGLLLATTFGTAATTGIMAEAQISARGVGGGRAFSQCNYVSNDPTSGVALSVYRAGAWIDQVVGTSFSTITIDFGGGSFTGRVAFDPIA